MTWVKSGKALRLGFGLMLALVAFGCGGGGSSPPSTVSVTVTPSSASLSFGGTQQFTAAVTGTSNAAVTWSVNDILGGNSTVGTISSSGLYTAPGIPSLPPNTPRNVAVTAGNTTSNINIAVSFVPGKNSITVKATSQADNAKSASASVSVSALSFIAAGLGTSGGGTAFTLAQGASKQLFLVGTGFLPGTTYAVSGPMPNDITLGQPSFFSADGSPCQTTDVPPLPCATVSISVSPSAKVGPRNIIVTNQAGELSVFVGGLVIVP